MLIAVAPTSSVLEVVRIIESSVEDEPKGTVASKVLPVVRRVEALELSVASVWATVGLVLLVELLRPRRVVREDRRLLATSEDAIELIDKEVVACEVAASEASGRLVVVMIEGIVGEANVAASD